MPGAAPWRQPNSASVQQWIRDNVGEFQPNPNYQPPSQPLPPSPFNWFRGGGSPQSDPLTDPTIPETAPVVVHGSGVHRPNVHGPQARPMGAPDPWTGYRPGASGPGYGINPSQAADLRLADFVANGGMPWRPDVIETEDQGHNLTYSSSRRGLPAAQVLAMMQAAQAAIPHARENMPQLYPGEDAFIPRPLGPQRG